MRYGTKIAEWMRTTKGRGAHRRILSAFRAGKVKLLVGTQLIAKRMTFPASRWPRWWGSTTSC